MAVKRQVVFGVASLAALYVGVTNALGLGELRLDSALNQPLSATISIQGGENVSPSDVLISLASPDAFEKAGIDRPHFLTDLRFIPVVENQRLIIRVESNRPVREPYLNFLVELRRPNGRMLREYTVLLDPPLFNGGATAAAAVSAPVSPRSEPASQPRPAPAAPVERAAAAPPASAPARQQARPPVTTLDLPDLSPAPDARTHRTAPGDTLWDLAVQHRPDRSIAIRESMAAIKALNPHAFVDGDLNRLRVNQDLVLPTAEQLRGTASAPVAAAADPAPRSEAAAAEGPAISETPAEQQLSDDSAAAPVSPGVAEEAAPATAAAQDAPIVSGQLRIEETTVSAAEADAAELLSRLQSLEARFNVLLNELDARDRQIESLQAELEVLRQARDAEESADALAGVPGGVLGGGEADSGPSSAEGSDAPGTIQAEALPAQDAQPQGFLASWWPAFAALGAFLLGLLVAGLRSRSREEEEVIDEPVEEPTAPARPGTALIGSSMVARPAAIQPKPIDPLDGVELYVTYGRFAEARAMLEKAISEEPGRLDLRYKLLRVLGELGDAGAFDDQVEQIRDMDGDEERIEQIRSRFPDLSGEASGVGMVEQVDHIEPLFDDEDLEGAFDTEATDEADAARQEAAGSQLNLNDFTLDPDWELIEGLTPPPRKSRGAEPAEEAEDIFESDLNEFPEVEELDDHDQHFATRDEDQRKK